VLGGGFAEKCMGLGGIPQPTGGGACFVHLKTGTTTVTGLDKGKIKPNNLGENYLGRGKTVWGGKGREKWGEEKPGSASLGGEDFREASELKNGATERV